MTEKTKKAADPKPTFVTTPADTPEKFPNLERDTFFDLHVGEIYLDTKKGGERLNLSIEGGISVYYQKDTNHEDAPTETPITKEDIEEVIMGIFNKIIPAPQQPTRVVSTPAPQPAPSPMPAPQQESISKEDMMRLIRSMEDFKRNMAMFIKVMNIPNPNPNNE